MSLYLAGSILVAVGVAVWAIGVLLEAREGLGKVPWNDERRAMMIKEFERQQLDRSNAENLY